MRRLVELLKELDELVTAVPPLPSNGRFGNAAFRTWVDRAEEVRRHCQMHAESEAVGAELASVPVSSAPGRQLITRSLAAWVPSDALPEVAAYAMHSFGNKQRIDYGTGHEAHFMVFLYAPAKGRSRAVWCWRANTAARHRGSGYLPRLVLRKLGLLTPEDNAAVVLRVFRQYAPRPRAPAAHQQLLLNPQVAMAVCPLCAS